MSYGHGTQSTMPMTKEVLILKSSKSIKFTKVMPYHRVPDLPDLPDQVTTLGWLKYHHL